MKKLKKLFETPKRAIILAACAVATVAVIGTGTAFATSAIAEGSAIGNDKAQYFAFADAGVDPVSAKNIHTEFEFEHGQFVYQVEFVHEGTEYEYWIKASDGTVVKKKVEIITLDGTPTKAVAKISLEDAKTIALRDAGKEKDEVSFTEGKLDVHNGVSVYDVEFDSGNIEYDYEINAENGAIYSRSKETITAQESSSTKNTQQTSQNRITLDAAKAKALSDAGVAAAEVKFTKAELDDDDGTVEYHIDFDTADYEYEYEIDAYNGAILEKSKEKRDDHSSSTSTGSTSTSISIDKAKSIAASHAGFSVQEVTFSKVKLESDDGKNIYEIEFYKDNVEYEYEIDAATGKIIEYDAEKED